MKLSKKPQKKKTIDEMSPEEMKTLYKLVPDPDNIDAEYWCVQLEKGDFKGLIYKYGTIGIAPKLSEEGTLPIKFEWDVLFVPEEILKLEMPDEKKDELENLVGNIMMTLVQDTIERGTTNYGEVGDDDSQKLVIRRDVHPSGDAIPKE